MAESKSSGRGRFKAPDVSAFREFLTLVPEAERKRVAGLVEKLNRVKNWDDFIDLEMCIMVEILRGSISPEIGEAISTHSRLVIDALLNREKYATQNKGLEVLAAELERRAIPMEGTYLELPMKKEEPIVIEMVQEEVKQKSLLEELEDLV